MDFENIINLNAKNFKMQFCGLLNTFYSNYIKNFLNKLGAGLLKVTHHTGEWTLIFILISLAMTPLRNNTNLLFWLKYRRMFGLFVFYASLHLFTYVGLDYRFDLDQY